jgi:hypothetical protein
MKLLPISDCQLQIWSLVLDLWSLNDVRKEEHENHDWNKDLRPKTKDHQIGNWQSEISNDLNQSAHAPAMPPLFQSR